jgi:uncharacterized protein YejL (UPF0352 family)
MANKYNAQRSIEKVIDHKIKHTVDDLIFLLEKKYDYHFSDSATMDVANITTEFISRLISTIQSENLVEPEYFEKNYMYK